MTLSDLSCHFLLCPVIFTPATAAINSATFYQGDAVTSVHPCDLLFVTSCASPSPSLIGWVVVVVVCVVVARFVTTSLLWCICLTIARLGSDGGGEVCGDC